jgi:predicted metal-dependent phosphoesterase TrpH
MALLKADLHVHTAEDPEDLVCYRATELINRAQNLGYAVLAVTNHNRVTYNAYLRDYARERGIVLLPGVEATIQGRHVLLYNLAFGDVDRSNLAALARVRSPESLIIAPHPFYPSPVSLRGLLRRHLSIFDAVEYCHFYTSSMDFNSSARSLAARHGLPLIGTSDAHQRAQLHTTYSIIDAEPKPEAVIEAIKAGRVRVVTSPLRLSFLFQVKAKMLWRNEVLQRFQHLIGVRGAEGRV